MGSRGEDFRITIIYLTIGFLILSGFIVFFIALFRIRLNRHLLEKQGYTQSLLQTQLEIQEQTLNTISQEIHDNIGQVLSLVKINLGSFPDIKDEAAVKKLKDTKELVGKAIRDLRDLSRSMHGDRIAELGLVESIANELTILEHSKQFKTQFKITGTSFKPDAQKEMVLFRIVQEALHNSTKHSGAKNLQVCMNYAGDLLTLTVCDDGNGFDMEAMAASQKGIGFKSMQNRATLIGAAFSMNSAPGKGTCITVQLKNNLSFNP